MDKKICQRTNQAMQMEDIVFLTLRDFYMTLWEVKRGFREKSIKNLKTEAHSSPFSRLGKQICKRRNQTM